MGYQVIDAMCSFDEVHDRPVADRRKRSYLAGVGLTIALACIIATAVTVKMSRSHWKSLEESTAKNQTPYQQPQSISELFFAASLPAFDQQVLNGYETCEDLKVDIDTALKSLAIGAIQQQKDYDPQWCNIQIMAASMDGASLTSAPTDSQMGKGADTLDANNAVAGESSYGTNNQVKGVDEADIVKSDGTHIFAGYGNEIIVTDLNGTIVTRIAVPDIEKVASETVDSSGANTSTVMPYYFGPTTRQVNSLLLNNDIVTAITHYDSWQCDYAICGGNTTAFIYKFNPDAKTLSLLSQVDMTGSFNGARSIGSYAHIVTNAYVDTWSFTSPFQRCNEQFTNMTSEEYEQAALNIVNQTVDDYANKLVKGLPWTQNTDAVPSCKNIIRISTMTNQNSTILSQARKLGGLSWFYNQGFLQNFVQLTSFDVNQGSMAGIKSSTSGSFVAESSPQVYAIEDKLVLACRGYRYDLMSGNDASYNEYTNLITFDLSGAVATPKSIGEVDGYFNDQYSMDYYDGFFRIATTNGQKWASSVNNTDGSYTWQTISESTSQLYVLEEQSSELVVVGTLKDLGKGETIQSVRFLGNKGYVVTFKQVDPLFIIDLSSPTNPAVASELKATGFSQYMHPIKDGNFLLTVGQEATTEGVLTGVKISVFNVTDPSAPSEVQKYVVENGDGWASTDASWDYYAFRYLDQSEVLIIPESVYNWQIPNVSFDGFVVYQIDLADGIKPLGNVTHADYDFMQHYCWGGAYLPSRSMVFNGDLVTFKSHSILRTSTVGTLKTKVWELNLDNGRNKSSVSCYNYGPWVMF